MAQVKVRKRDSLETAYNRYYEQEVIPSRKSRKMYLSEEEAMNLIRGKETFTSLYDSYNFYDE